MAQVQLAAMHWRDRAIEKSQIISDGWQVFLAWTGRAAEIVLFICMAISLIQMIPSITLNNTFTGGVFVVQMITLDVAGFGLTTLAKAVKRAGDEETASKAATISMLLIGIMVVSMLSGGIDRLFGGKDGHFNDVHTYMTYVDDFLILVRVGMTVFYGKIMHSLRDSQQHMQAQTDTRIADLEADLTKARTEQQRLQKALTDEQTSLKKQHAENEKLAQQLAAIQESLRDALQSGTDVQASMHKAIREKNENDSQIQQLKADLQAAKATIYRLQNAENETAKLQMERQKLTANLEAANLQIADLAAKLERAKSKNADLQNAGRSSAKQTAKDNVTSIEQARAKNRPSHAEVIAFMTSHPDLKRAEVAAQLQISERKVYDAIAWQREQEQENAVVSQ